MTRRSRTFPVLPMREGKEGPGTAMGAVFSRSRTDRRTR